MPRTPFVVLGFVLALLAPSAAAAQDAEEPTTPPLKATLSACASGPESADRFAIFTGSMPAMAGTRRMAMKFDLYVRSRPGKWKSVKHKGFGRWQRSLVGKSGFVYTKRVERMRQAAAYRAVVRFRWYDADGVQRQTTRRTPVCDQEDQRPNLTIQLLDVMPGEGGMARYVLRVGNDGATAAPEFTVALLGEDEPVERTVPGLPAGETTTVELTGRRRCTSDDPIAFRVDPDDDVDEASERDNRSRWLCGGR